MTSLLWDARGVLALVGSQHGGRLDRLTTRLHPLTSRPLPSPGVGSLVRNAVDLDLLNAWDPAAGTQPKLFWVSTDDGRTWHRRPDPIRRGYAVSLQSAAPGLLWRYGRRSEIWRSTNDGESWEPLLVRHFAVDDYQLQAFSSYGRSAWAFGFLDDKPRLGVFRSTDAGAHWRASTLP